MTSLSRELGREISIEETAAQARDVFTSRYLFLSSLNPQLSTPR
jgi:hypothetical protein